MKNLFVTLTLAAAVNDSTQFSVPSGVYTVVITPPEGAVVVKKILN